jgi:hypothetical protein
MRLGDDAIFSFAGGSARDRIVISVPERKEHWTSTFNDPTRKTGEFEVHRTDEISRFHQPLFAGYFDVGGLGEYIRKNLTVTLVKLDPTDRRVKRWQVIPLDDLLQKLVRKEWDFYVDILNSIRLQTLDEFRRSPKLIAARAQTKSGYDLIIKEEGDSLRMARIAGLSALLGQIREYVRLSPARDTRFF